MDHSAERMEETNAVECPTQSPFHLVRHFCCNSSLDYRGHDGLSRCDAQYFLWRARRAIDCRKFECRETATRHLDMGSWFSSFLGVGSTAQRCRICKVRAIQPGPNAKGFGWSKLEIQDMDSKIRIKFKEVHHSNLWGLKLNLFSSKVSNKDSVKVLDKLHKDMEVNKCKKGARARRYFDYLA